MDFVNINGKILPGQEAGINFNNRSYRYGEGLFETMKIVNGKILLADLHFKRLLHGFELLEFQPPEFFFVEKLEEEILEVAVRNRCDEFGRVRLSVSAGEGALFDGHDKVGYLIECTSL